MPQIATSSTTITQKRMNTTNNMHDSAAGNQINIAENIEAAYGNIYKLSVQLSCKDLISIATDEELFDMSLKSTNLFKMRFDVDIVDMVIRTKLLLWQKANLISDQEVRRLHEADLIELNARIFRPTPRETPQFLGHILIGLSFLSIFILVVSLHFAETNYLKNLIIITLSLMHAGIACSFSERFYLSPARIQRRIKTQP